MKSDKTLSAFLTSCLQAGWGQVTAAAALLRWILSSYGIALCLSFPTFKQAVLILSSPCKSLGSVAVGSCM